MKTYILTIALLLPLFGDAQTRQGELRGIVTYTTDNGRALPDGGAEVIIYFIDTVKAQGDVYDKYRREDSIVNNSCLATIYYDIFETTPIKRSQKQMVRKLKQLDAYPEARLRELDDRAAAIIKDRTQRQYVTVVADQNGRYSVKLPAGYYGLIFRSAHLRSHSGAEHRGNIALGDVAVRAGETTHKNEEML